MEIPYKTKEQVHNRAKDAIGIPFSKLMQANNLVGVKSNKSMAGDAWEAWFKINKNSNSGADLSEVGIELKATPYKKLRNGTVSAKERLVLNIINYMKEYGKTFETSSFWEKNKLMEIGFYEYTPDIPRNEWTITEAILYTFPEKDLKIIKQDWAVINQYINEGRAHELTEGLTNYLAACTKGANKESVRSQPCSTEKAKQRAYSLKASYMTYILRNYVFGDLCDPAIQKKRFASKSKLNLSDIVSTDNQEESLIDNETLNKTTFNEYLINKLQDYVGKTDTELADYFKIKQKNSRRFPKNIYSMLTSRMLGLKGNVENTEEITKANILVKTIRIQKKGTIRENMSFPSFKFKDLCNEVWEDSTLRNLLDSSRFLFVVFKENYAGEYVFIGSKFWSMPELDLDGVVKIAWKDTVNNLKKGVEIVYNKNRKRSENNFINKSDNRIISVRPHAAKAGYTSNNKNADELPTPAHWTNKPKEYSDKWMTKQSFWLNNDYILDQIQDLFTNINNPGLE